MFSVDVSTGTLDPPRGMDPWIAEQFGSSEAVTTQTVTRIVNRWTLEGSSFNELRARRPVQRDDAPPPSDDADDPFCDPERRTPADDFGRIRGDRSVTASNIAKWDGLHSLVIFDTHDPLNWSHEQVVDAFRTARRWVEVAHAEHPGAVYPLVTWNCMPRGGASVIHPHLQVVLGGAPTARVELWRRAAHSYHQQHARPYFEDLAAAHDVLGLAGPALDGVRWLAHLTPVKERELVLLGAELDDAMAASIFRLLSILRDRLGVRAFNLAAYLPPVGPVDEDWGGFPTIVRIVDRGDPVSATSDVGAMELFAQPVVASDPWRLAAAVRAAGGS